MILRKFEKNQQQNLVFIKKSILYRRFYPITKEPMIIDGHAIANDILVNLRKEVEKLPIKPKLSVILV